MTTSVEFETKDADKTMATMVQEPYVNHIPTITGGIGYKDLRRFYAEFFIPGKGFQHRASYGRN